MHVRSIRTDELVHVDQAVLIGQHVAVCYSRAGTIRTGHLQLFGNVVAISSRYTKKNPVGRKSMKNPLCMNGTKAVPTQSTDSPTR